MDEAAYRTLDVGMCMNVLRYYDAANMLTEATRPSAAQRFAASQNENPIITFYLSKKLHQAVVTVYQLAELE